MRACLLCLYLSLSLAQNILCNTVAYITLKKKRIIKIKTHVRYSVPGCLCLYMVLFLAIACIGDAPYPRHIRYLHAHRHTHTIQKARERCDVRVVFVVVYFIICSAYMRARILSRVAAELQRCAFCCFRCRYRSGVTTHVVVRFEVRGGHKQNRNSFLYLSYIPHNDTQNNSRALRPSLYRHPGPGRTQKHDVDTTSPTPEHIYIYYTWST